MSDLQIVYFIDSSSGLGDLSFQNNDLVQDNGLTTSVIISLFTKRRANDDDILPDSLSDDKNGWWGDLALPDVENDEIGSRLWLLERAKATEKNLILGKIYIKEALQWIIDDLVASSVDVEVERQGAPGSDVFAYSIVIKRGSETVLQTSIKYTDKWEAQLNAV